MVKVIYALLSDYFTDVEIVQQDTQETVKHALILMNVY